MPSLFSYFFPRKSTYRQVIPKNTSAVTTLYDTQKKSEEKCISDVSGTGGTDDINAVKVYKVSVKPVANALVISTDVNSKDVKAAVLEIELYDLMKCIEVTNETSTECRYCYTDANNGKKVSPPSSISLVAIIMNAFAADCNRKMYSCIELREGACDLCVILNDYIVRSPDKCSSKAEMGLSRLQLVIIMDIMIAAINEYNNSNHDSEIQKELVLLVSHIPMICSRTIFEESSATCLQWSQLIETVCHSISILLSLHRSITSTIIVTIMSLLEKVSIGIVQYKSIPKVYVHMYRPLAACILVFDYVLQYFVLSHVDIDAIGKVYNIARTIFPCADDIKAAIEYTIDQSVSINTGIFSVTVNDVSLSYVHNHQYYRIRLDKMITNTVLHYTYIGLLKHTKLQSVVSSSKCSGNVDSICKGIIAILATDNSNKVNSASFSTVLILLNALSKIVASTNIFTTADYQYIFYELAVHVKRYTLHLKNISSSGSASLLEVDDLMKTVSSTVSSNGSDSCEVYAVGDLVDGAIITQNGIQRWFSGVVKACNASGTYHIEYYDGDVDCDKSGHDIRYTKRRKPFKKTRILSQQSNDSNSSDASSSIIQPKISLSPRSCTNKCNTHIHKQQQQSLFSDLDDDNFFEIPSVFEDDDHVVMASTSNLSDAVGIGIVPRMNLIDVHPVASTANSMMGQSLSSSLLLGMVDSSSASAAVKEVDVVNYHELCYASSIICSYCCSILLQRCVSSSCLDESCCILRCIASEAVSMTNLLFIVREYIEQLNRMCLTSSIDIISNSNCSSESIQCYSIVLKLLSTGSIADSCLPFHNDANRIKIGEGGFGSIHKVTCTCPNACYKRKCTTATASSTSYAIKKLSRESSEVDTPKILAVYLEVLGLYLLRGLKGVCELVDFGAYGSEYWIVMRCGRANLRQWRNETSDSDAAISKNQLLLCMLLYRDILLIVDSIHAKDVVHFDLKCDNFIMMDEIRSIDDATVSHMRQSHATGQPSGLIFLADFGECVPYSRGVHAGLLTSRVRGTLCIQSPEMLSISTSSSNSNSETISSSSSSSKAVTFPEPPSRASDVWSLGCLLFELISGQYLFYNHQFTELFVLLCLQRRFGPLPIEPLFSIIAAINADGSDKILTSIAEMVRDKILTPMLQQLPDTRSSINDVIAAVSRLLHTVLTDCNDMTNVVIDTTSDNMDNRSSNIDVSSRSIVDLIVIEEQHSSILQRPSQCIRCSISGRLYFNVMNRPCNASILLYDRCSIDTTISSNVLDLLHFNDLTNVIVSHRTSAMSEQQQSVDPSCHIVNLVSKHHLQCDEAVSATSNTGIVVSTLLVDAENPCDMISRWNKLLDDVKIGVMRRNRIIIVNISSISSAPAVADEHSSVLLSVGSHLIECISQIIDPADSISSCYAYRMLQKHHSRSITLF